GAGVVITDTNLRRVISLPGVTDIPVSSAPLRPREQVPERDLSSLFMASATQTTVSFGEAARITASSYGGVLGQAPPTQRPANAFDGNPNSAWLTGGFSSDPRGAWVRIVFHHSRRVDHARVVLPKARSGLRYVNSVMLRFSDGSRVSAP